MAAPTVALNTPADVATGVSTTPALLFTGTDAESNEIEYNVQVVNMSSWYHPDWSNRVKITALAAKVDADLTDFPVFVDLSTLPAGFHTNVNQTDARDIRVTKSDGITEIPREVVFYTAASDTGELHFKASGATLKDATNVDFYIYYGNSGASDYAVNGTYGRDNVWDSNYVGVWHMSQSPDNTVGQITDSSGTGNHGQSQGTPVTATGKVGKGIDFESSSSQFVRVPDNNSQDMTTNYSAEVWYKLESLPAVGQEMQLISKDDETNGRAYTHDIAARATSGAEQEIRAYINGFSPNSQKTYPTGTITTGNWYHFATSKNNSGNYYLLHNGSVVTTSSGSGSINVNSDYLTIASRTYSGYEQYFDGILDEIRLSNTDRSTPWLSTGYNNQNDQSTFFTIGAQEDFTPLLNKLSVTPDPTFAGTGDPHPWPSGNQVTYTVQAGDILTASTIYYWRVRGIDPLGGNTYGAWSTTRSFTTAGGSTMLMMGV